MKPSRTQRASQGPNGHLQDILRRGLAGHSSVAKLIEELQQVEVNEDERQPTPTPRPLIDFCDMTGPCQDATRKTVFVPGKEECCSLGLLGSATPPLAFSKICSGA